MNAIQDALDTTAVLDEVFAIKGDGRWLLCWDLTGSTLHGLTPAGLSRAMTATSKWITSLSAADQAALHQVAARITVGMTSWQIPFIPGQQETVKDLMQGVLRQPGSLGRIS